MKPLWECDAWRRGKRDELNVFIGVTVNPDHQTRVRRVIERDVRERLAGELEAQVREQVRAEVVGVALEYRATLDAMRATLAAREPHDFDRDDLIRYGAYASAWESAAARIARGGAS